MSATSVLSVDNLNFTSNGSTSLAKLTATADVMTMSGAGGNVELKGIANPTEAQSVATKNYVDSIVGSGVYWKEPARVATTTNGTLATAFANGETVDGIVLATGDRILIKDQTTATENGMYVVQASGAPVRASDYNTGEEIAGFANFVLVGTSNADKGFVNTNDPPNDVVGTDNLAWGQFSGTGSITAGAGLTKTGDTLSVNVDDSSIEISGDTLQVKDLGITNAMLAGSIDNAKLSNSTIGLTAGTSGTDIAVSGSPASLGDSITINIPDASATARGVITIGAQTIAGAKTLSGITTVSDTTQSTVSTDGCLVLSGGVGIAKDIRCAGTGYAVAWEATSDARLKENFKSINNATEVINSLDTYEYNFIGDDKQHTGIMAQDLLELYPNAVGKDSRGNYSVNYNEVFTLLLQSHKELSQEVKELKKNKNKKVEF